ncbi:UvrB/UvrC motif-containing protein [Tuwongella immobilis]|uniref:UVR domain-containing protein n=1 Tax=Tuwongella immobilis TaxID=692036 RepID=A0A6C2YLS1_9BACT|nr:UvrB/UvrC motif-containing protein [Tuwongella immobilis]VIP02376.1 protein : Marine sediment metagenome DNA, contig: S01H1_L03107 OS=marine sediment metagenome GN=S01H1_09650 PE=4 SV=1: UVR [Tuwongella immobilis]VTS01214.1 protein : Marine sediment metagenome DNA, contig: S01H1_L03107 OS=marine sediment metagenome GN=S01H1_09650 PE=4 SV=1: UVR [Tuwongella immobilis]
MAQDIDFVLKTWKFRPDSVLARLVTASDGREVLQLRLELGLMQLEVADRPDGQRPGGFPTYFAYLQDLASLAEQAGRRFVLDANQCDEADREFMQFYHRRICWMTLERFDRAVADAEHTLAFMDFVRDHSPNDEFTQAHEQYRSFVLFHWAQSKANAAQQREDWEAALDALRDGMERIHTFYRDHDREEEFEANLMVQQLQHQLASLRKRHGIPSTLEEQLAAAIAAEDYERAAQLRDAIKQRQSARRTEPDAEA